MTKNHTPTPWKAYPDGPVTKQGQRIFGPADKKGDQKVVATLDWRSPADENAAFIVRAVNAHDALVAALEAIAHHDEFTGATPDNLALFQAYNILNALRVKAAAALELAKC